MVSNDNQKSLQIQASNVCGNGQNMHSNLKKVNAFRRGTGGAYLDSLCFFMYLAAQLPQGRFPSHFVFLARQRSQLAQRAIGVSFLSVSAILVDVVSTRVVLPFQSPTSLLPATHYRTLDRLLLLV